MTSVRKAVLFGFLIWLIPFVVAFIIFPLRESSRPLFESIMPVTVAVDAGGTSAHITGPAEWQKRIASGEFKGIGVAAA